MAMALTDAARMIAQIAAVNFMAMEFERCCCIEQCRRYGEVVCKMHFDLRVAFYLCLCL